MQINKILSKAKFNEDNIYSLNIDNEIHKGEIIFREKISQKKQIDYFKELKKHHSIEVMDKEVLRILKKAPKNAVIIDVGGCWGWHWRKIHFQRPDVKVVIVDLVRSNLLHAKKILNDRINKNIFLVHGDALNLDFPSNSFDIYWSVQTIQHIPEFNKVIIEAYRILKPNAIFINYSFNRSKLVKFVYSIFGKLYFEEGKIPGGTHYLSRASNQQKKIIKDIFKNEVLERYTEILFQLDLKMNYTTFSFLFGRIDALLSNNLSFFKYVCNQICYEVKKKI